MSSDELIPFLLWLMICQMSIYTFFVNICYTHFDINLYQQITYYVYWEDYIHWQLLLRK